MWASMVNPNPEIIRTLLENGAKVDDRDEQGTGAMWAAMGNKNPEAIATLLAEKRGQG